MIIFDFLYYYLMIWFNNRQVLFKKTFPSERVSYGLGIMAFLWFECIDIIVEFIIFRSFVSVIPLYVSVLIAIMFMWLFDYIYIKKKRYEKIVVPEYQNRSLKANTGIIISMLVIFMSLFVTLAATFLLHLVNDGAI